MLNISPKLKLLLPAIPIFIQIFFLFLGLSLYKHLTALLAFVFPKPDMTNHIFKLIFW